MTTRSFKSPPKPKHKKNQLQKREEDRKLLKRLAKGFDNNSKVFTEILMGLEETVNAVAAVVNEMATGQEVKLTEEGSSVDFNHYIISYRELIERSKAMQEAATDKQVEVVSPEEIIRMEDDVQVFGGK